MRKECLKCDCTSDTKIWMVDVQGGDILDHKSILQYSQFWLSNYLLKHPKLGIQLPNAGDENQSVHILMVFLIESIVYGFRSITSTVVLLQYFILQTGI